MSEEKKDNTLFMIAAWLWAGVPLAWGISQTIVKAAALFK